MPKPFIFESIAIGEVLGQKQMQITDDLVHTCAQAIESTHPWYFESSPFGGRIAPPTFFDNDTLRTLDEAYERFGSIHAKQSWEFKQPALVGSTVTVTVRVVDKFTKRGGNYIVMELLAVDEQEREICRSLHTSLMSLHRG